MIVQTKNGKVRGFETASIAGGKKYFSYLGVPYAKPPTGDLRFSPPEPVENWNEIYDATYERDQCFQINPFLGGEIAGSDDCLYLNIHTPDVNPKSLKPVLFFLHGGGFFFGSGEEASHGADYLINHDVVLVTINYRLHILGFLNLEIPECPGNAGLKDQVMALKWVKENIKAFGGDPDNITIDGCSAGATSVNHLMISPLTKGLFQKAILECGTSLSGWALTHDPLKWAFKAAQMLGFEGTDRSKLLNFLRNEPLLRLGKVAGQLLKEQLADYPARGLYCPFSPSVEKIKEGAVLPDFPQNLAHIAPPIPCIAGYATVERIYDGKYILENVPKATASTIKEIIRSNFIVEEPQLTHIQQKLAELYLQQNDPKKSNQEKIEELLTDICCLYFYDALEFVAKSKIPPYVFHFTYFSDNQQSLIRKMFEPVLPLTKNAFHGEEQRFILACKKLEREPFKDSTDKEVQKNMCQLWTNFMKTGNPTSEGVDIVWKPHTTQDSNYLDIGAKFELKDGKITEKRINLLKSLLRGIEIRK